MEKIWRWLVLCAASIAGYFCFRVLNRLEVIGAPQCSAPPTVFYANHPRSADPFVILFGCLLRPLDVVRARNPAVWSVGYAGHFTGWRRHLIRPARIIPYAPLESGNLQYVTEEMTAVLGRGEHLLIFPEGRRHQGSDPANLAPFRQGLAWLAQRCNAQVQPVAVLGTDVLFPRGSWLPRFGQRMKVVFGPAIPSSRWNGENRREITAHLEQELRMLLRATH